MIIYPINPHITNPTITLSIIPPPHVPSNPTFSQLFKFTSYYKNESPPHLQYTVYCSLLAPNLAPSFSTNIRKLRSPSLSIRADVFIPPPTGIGRPRWTLKPPSFHSATPCYFVVLVEKSAASSIRKCLPIRNCK